MMVVLGMVVGFVLGALALDLPGGLAGAFVGFIVTMVWRSRTQAAARQRARQIAMQADVEAAARTASPAPSQARADARWEAADVSAARSAPRAAPFVPSSGVAPPASPGEPLDRRVAALEARVAMLERWLGAGARAPRADVGATVPGEPESHAAPVASPPASGPGPALHVEPALPDGERGVRTATPAPSTPPRGTDVDAGAIAARESLATDPPGFIRTPAGTIEPAPRVAPESSLPGHAATHGAAARMAARAAGATRTSEVALPQRPANPVWAWLTGGNALTRIGVIALFVGVGFLLRYLADYVTVPIGLRLAGIAVGGFVLMGLGLRIARRRPGYGVSLVGAGVGVLYLTTYSALRLYGVLDPGPAFALLAVIAAATVGLAMRADSQPLAGLAVAGGFLAPFLASTSSGSPAMLLGYFLVLNVVIAALALARSWRALNALGFVFTFVLGGLWGHRFYRPEHFAVVEPFLVTFFLLYVAVAILHARRAPLEAKRPVDGLLVFGVPLVAFALQAGLVRDTRYGVAISAVALAALYALLALLLRRRAEAGLTLLGRAFVALAVVFLTAAIPFAADPYWTPAWWALEAAAVYWIGCVQRQPLARGFALVLQAGAALAFFLGAYPAAGTPFFNATYLGGIVIALAAMVTVRVIDRHPDAVGAAERSLAPPLFAWGIAWWLAAGAIEIDRVTAEAIEAHAMLGYAVVSVVLALALTRLLRWSRLAWAGVVLLPVLVVVSIRDWHYAHTTLVAYGAMLWPAAWAVQWIVLRALEPMVDREAGPRASPERRWLPALHAASAVALVAWVAWEASEWAGRSTPAASVWMACAAVWPALLYLMLVMRMAPDARWPFGVFRGAYVQSAGTVIATAAAVWFLLANVLSPGSAAPLPYAPLVNPLDLTLVTVVAVLFVWARRELALTERGCYAWLGVAVFLLVNAIVFRTVHHWLDVPWRLSALVASKTAQAALTLAWTVTALPLMIYAHRRAVRLPWMVGMGLLVLVVVKLFALDLAALSGLPRIVAFIGVGLLLLVIGYFAPLPPAAVAGATDRPARRSRAGADAEPAQDRFQEAPAGEPALQQVRTHEGGEREPPLAHE